MATGVYKGKPCSDSSVKKRIDFQGIRLCIDRPKGFTQTGVGADGKPWSRTYKFDYGFIPKTLGGDDDGLDVFIGPDKSSHESYWALQNKDDGTFDEYKVFLGFPTREAALAAYRDHIPKKLMGGFVTMKVDMMRAMLGIGPTGQVKVAMAVSCLDELSKIAEADGLTGVKHRVAEMLQQAQGVGARLAGDAGLDQHKGLGAFSRQSIEESLRHRLFGDLRA